MEEIKKRALELVALLEAEHSRLPEGDRKDVLALAWYGLNLIDELETKGHKHCVVSCIGVMGSIAMRLGDSLIPQLTPGEKLQLAMEELLNVRERLQEEDADFIDVPRNSTPV